MSLTVLEAMQIGELKKMVLIAGQNGTTNTINTVGILDHEIVESKMTLFREGDFVLSTFTAARDNEQLLIQCIRDLIDYNIAGLAIKKIYYSELPQEIIDYANEKSFPLFMYDSKTYTENIIRDLSMAIHSRFNQELLSSKIDLLFKNDYSPQVNERIAHEINPYFHQEFVVLYLKDKYYVSDVSMLQITEQFTNSESRSNHHTLVKYNDGIIIILSYKHITQRDIEIDFHHIVQQYKIDLALYSIGKSQFSDDLGTFDMRIKEAIYASHLTSMFDTEFIDYNQIGLYKFLLPHINDKWLRNFAADILNPIKNYDDGKLIDTAQKYVHCKHDVIKTAELLFQHKNTIRYRIKIMQELTGIENIHDFNEQLSIAIKLESLTLKNIK